MSGHPGHPLDPPLELQPRSFAFRQQFDVNVDHRVQQLYQLIEVQPSMVRLGVQSLMPALHVVISAIHRPC